MEQKPWGVWAILCAHWANGAPYCLIQYPVEQLKVIYNVLTMYKLVHRRNAAIIGFACQLLAGEG